MAWVSWGYRIEKPYEQAIFDQLSARFAGYPVPEGFPEGPSYQDISFLFWREETPYIEFTPEDREYDMMGETIHNTYDLIAYINRVPVGRSVVQAMDPITGDPANFEGYIIFGFVAFDPSQTARDRELLVFHESNDLLDSLGITGQFFLEDHDPIQYGTLVPNLETPTLILDNLAPGGLPRSLDHLALRPHTNSIDFGENVAPVTQIPLFGAEFPPLAVTEIPLFITEFPGVGETVIDLFTDQFPDPPVTVVPLFEAQFPALAVTQINLFEAQFPGLPQTEIPLFETEFPPLIATRINLFEDEFPTPSTVHTIPLFTAEFPLQIPTTIPLFQAEFPDISVGNQVHLFDDQFSGLSRVIPLFDTEFPGLGTTQIDLFTAQFLTPGVNTVPLFEDQFVLVEALIGRVYVENLVGRVPVEALVGKVYPEHLVGRVRVAAFVGRVYVRQFVGRVRVQVLVGRVRVFQEIGRIERELLVGRVPVRQFVGRVHVEQLVGRVPIASRDVGIILFCEENLAPVFTEAALAYYRGCMVTYVRARGDGLGILGAQADGKLLYSTQLSFEDERNCWYIVSPQGLFEAPQGVPYLGDIDDRRFALKGMSRDISRVRLSWQELEEPICK